ncbi:magnesium transporter, partial [Vibrio breoganii]
MLINHFPTQKQEQLTEALPSTWQVEEKAALIYDPSSAGGICKSEILKLPATATVSKLSNLLADNEHSYEYQEWRYVYLYNNDGCYIGGI